MLKLSGRRISKYDWLSEIKWTDYNTSTDDDKIMESNDNGSRGQFWKLCKKLKIELKNFAGSD